MYLYTHDIDKYTNVSIEIDRQKTGERWEKKQRQLSFKKKLEKKHVEEITAYTRRSNWEEN